MLARLAHIVMRRRWWFIAGWIGLTLLGVYSAQAVSTRWLEEFSIPGYSAYEANQRALETFGTGAQPPHVIVLSSQGDITENDGVAAAIEKVSAQFPDFRVASFFTTDGNRSLRLARPAHDVRDLLSAGATGLRRGDVHRRDPPRIWGGRPTGRGRPPDRTRCAL